MALSDAQLQMIRDGYARGMAQYNATGTFNGKTVSQNQAAVINQPGNTTSVTDTPYIKADGTTDYHISGQPSPTPQPTDGGSFVPVGKLGDTSGDTSKQPSGGGTPPPPPGNDLSGITDTATKTINDKIAAQIAAYNQQLASSQAANLTGVTQNNAALAQQLQGLGTQHTVDTGNAKELQNRRGGFYSGGLNYQLGSEDRAYATQEGNLNQDVQNRNDALYANNALMATQAAANIQMLQSQAPDMIKQAIQDELDRQRGINIQEAGLTGNYNGQQTLAAQGQYFKQGIDQAGLTGNYLGNRTIAGQNADLNQMQTMATLTGYMSDGNGGYMPTNAKQQQDLSNAWTESENLGTVSPNLSRLTGIPVGTQTQAAKYQAQQINISQQNATNAKNNTNADNARQDNAITLAADQKAYASTIEHELGQATSKDDVVKFFNLNAGDITNKLGSDAFMKMRNDALAQYDTPAKDTSAADEAALRKQAVSLAQNDLTAWSKAKTTEQKQALIDEYMNLLRGSTPPSP